MEATARVRYLRTAPRKARLVVDAVRGRKVGEALSLLDLSVRKAAAGAVAKILKSAVANMQSKHAEAAIDVDELRIKEIKVEEGPVLKRFRPCAHGRASRILKHMCHISVTIVN
ncbi:MAG: 50S ribosomal protein L22 [Chitinispirillaceae bacterium]|nr:50S ribosomal protein L22 [Chitinispirillaceae bacterium]